MRWLALAGTLWVVGCAAPPTPPAGDPRITLTPNAGVFADPPVVTLGPPLRASIRLINPSSVDLRVVQTTDWFKDDGSPVRSILSTPQHFTVPRFGDAMIPLVSPAPAATNFHIRVESDY